MSYVTRADVEAEIDPRRLADMLDDDRDKAEDAGKFDSLAATVDSEIDGVLSARYSVPFATTPSYVRHAARVMFCDLLYRRAGAGDDVNPFRERASAVRERLDLVASGAAALSADDGEAICGVTDPTDFVFHATDDADSEEDA